LTGHRARESKLTPADLLYAAKGPEARDLKAQLVFLSNEREALRLKMFDLVPQPNNLDVLPHIKEDPKQDEACQTQRREEIPSSDLIDPRFQKPARPVPAERRKCGDASPSHRSPPLESLQLFRLKLVGTSLPV